MIKKILFIFIIFTSILSADETFEEGIDYELINSKPSLYELKKLEKIVVIEAFWYGCPHCYVFEDYLSKWKTKDDKDIKFINMPVVFNKTWLLHARAFYTMLGLENFQELHKIFFYAYHEQQRTFPTADSIIDFLDNQGADKAKVKDIFFSESVSKSVQEANYKLETYEIDSVPAIIINDKYKISGRMAKTYERMLSISKYIIDLERKNRLKLDWIIISIYLLLVGFGVGNILSSSISGEEIYLFDFTKLYGKQFIYTLISLFVGFIVISIDVKKNGSKYEVYSNNGSNPTGLSPVEWAQECQKMDVAGAGGVFTIGVVKKMCFEMAGRRRSKQS